jgi:hypothetical protein
MSLIFNVGYTAHLYALVGLEYICRQACLYVEYHTVINVINRPSVLCYELKSAAVLQYSYHTVCVRPVYQN